MKCLFALLVGLAACGDDDEGDPIDDGGAPDADGANDAAPPLELRKPEAPSAAMLPRFESCPTGWATARSRGDVAICAPFGGTPQTCTGPSAQFPSSAACQHIGPACPVGEWPEDLPTDRSIVYLRPGASGGAGTRVSPFGTLASALAVAPDGALIAIAKGELAEDVTIDRPVELRGACADETRIAGFDDQATPTETLTIRGAFDVALRNLAIGSPESGAIDARDGARLVVEGVWVAEPADDGIVASDATLDATGVLIDHPLSDSSSAVFCGGLRCALHDVALRGVSYVGISTNGATLDLRNVVVTGAPMPNYLSIGWFAGPRTTATVEGFVVLDTSAGISANSARTTLDHAWFEDLTRPAIGLTANVTGTYRHVYARGRDGTTLLATETGAVTFEDVVIEDVVEPDDSDTSAIIQIDSNATVTVTRVLLDHVRTLGLVAASAATVTGTDFVVRDVSAAPASYSGYGLFLDEATVDLSRVRIERCSRGAVLAFGGTARATLRDLVVETTGDVGTGLGVGGIAGADVELVRASIHRARSVGLAAIRAGTRVHGTDIEITDTQPNAEGDIFGRAIEVEDEASVEIERAVLARSRDHSVVSASGANVTLREVSIVDSTPRGCAASTCTDSPFGIGVGAYGGRIALEGFELRRASLCAVHFDSSSYVQLRRGVVAESTVGVCVDGDYDIAALENDVRYEANERNLDAITLPVPALGPDIPVPGLE